ncbi:hypothetical protein KKD81_00150 [Patescibacteria group bacterium]|nr:hypothetical protein [Patescibacteria group bacterium]
MYDLLQQYLPGLVSAFVAALVIWLVSGYALKHTTDVDARKLIKGVRFILWAVIVASVVIVFIKAASVEAIPRSTIDRSAGDEAQQSLEERISNNTEN